MPNSREPLPSASVILLDPERDGEDPFAIFVLRRQAGSSFMPDRYVFPGGRVEPSDGDDPLAPSSLQRAALRELWEEAGVILATDAQKAASLPRKEREAARAALNSGDLGLDEALAGLGLAPDLGALVPYARWITPKARSKRFDTIFYVAAMPPGQRAEADNQETTQGLWLGPAQGLLANQAGEVSLAPPQVRLLGELSQYPNARELLERDPGDLEPVQPVMWLSKEMRMVLLPWDPDHAAGRPGAEGLPGQACPAHLASRMVESDGRWLPYRCVA